MLKKIYATIFAALLLVSISGPAYAIQNGNQMNSNIVARPHWTMINTVYNWMDIDSSGLASMYSQITAHSGMADSVEISAYLEKYENGSWVTVNHWDQSYPGTFGSMSETYYVNKGHSYRLHTYFYAYLGSNYESTSLISATVYY